MRAKKLLTIALLTSLVPVPAFAKAAGGDTPRSAQTAAEVQLTTSSVRKSLQVQSSIKLRPARVPMAEQAQASRDRSVGAKVAWGAVGGVGGFFGGFFLGAAIENAGATCGCDDPGLTGAVIGAPIGAVIGAILAVKLASR